MTNKMITGGFAAAFLATLGGAGIALAQSDATAAPTLSEAQAIEIALAEVPGEVKETELESEDGLQVYEIEILTAEGKEMEVEIHAGTGEVMDVEAEDDDNEDDEDDDDKN